MKYILLSAIVLMSYTIHAQFVENYQSEAKEEKEIIHKRPVYLNLSAGLDNHVGLAGIGFSVPVAEKFGVRTGIGIGGWGVKYNLGIKRMEFGKDGWGFGLGYSYCPGIKDIDLSFSSTSSGTSTFNMDLLPVGSVNLTFNKNWVLWKTNMLYLESGYAIKTGGSNIYRVNSGGNLNSSDESFIELLRPGGIILAIGLQIGL